MSALAEFAIALYAIYSFAAFGDWLGALLRAHDDRRRTRRRCARGEHRETVKDMWTPWGGWLGFYCLDCGHVRHYCAGVVFTPQRRQKHGRAA